MEETIERVGIAPNLKPSSKKLLILETLKLVTASSKKQKVFSYLKDQFSLFTGTLEIILSTKISKGGTL